jgi:hypothetical protein
MRLATAPQDLNKPVGATSQLPKGLWPLPIVAKFSAHLLASGCVAFGTHSQQRKLS